jgi:3-hydroxyisobutyrate dehydrogenase
LPERLRFERDNCHASHFCSEGVEVGAMAGHFPKLAVLGLGTMGRAMVGSTLRAGIPVVVWNRDHHVSESMADQGVDVAIYRYGTGVAVGSQTGSRISTIGVDATKQISSITKDRRADAHFVDAPLSGSRGPAEEGELLIFASGPEEARPLATPVFDAIG